MNRMFAIAASLTLAAASAQAQDTRSTTYQTAQGELTVTSGQPAPRDFGPAPAFAQLSGGAGHISEDAAAAYPPLANDFIHADGNRDGRISSNEYARWTSRGR
ncbi:MAG: hypothetical protein EOP90_01400 [Lysobacteraceae bacterium]|nr:MAG: hypothetical protein EOP90_01400 [Xanthomonadaceae bacterium]